MKQDGMDWKRVRLAFKEMEAWLEYMASCPGMDEARVFVKHEIQFLDMSGHYRVTRVSQGTVILERESDGLKLKVPMEKIECLDIGIHPLFRPGNFKLVF